MTSFHFELNQHMIENPSEKIWKYMDLAMFISLLSKSALYFRCPIEFEDPFEGYGPKPPAVEFAKNYKETIADLESKRDEGVDFLKRIPESLENKIKDYVKLKSDAAYKSIEELNRCIDGLDRSLADEVESNISNHGVNCWHKSEHESDAMWKLYSASGQGVAIESTIGQLKNSIQHQEGLEIKSVVYLAENESGKEHGGLNVLLLKRKSFEHEKELRAIIPLKKPKESLFLGCDLENLITRIHISPLAPPYLKGIVEEICAGKMNGINKPIIRSTLLDKPDYRLKALY